ncbi:MAG: glutathione S-transferase C-terminal domain-containing protein [Thalassotalea sp.]
MNKNINTFTSMRNDRQLHLYLAWGCPFCHRILASLAITKLYDNISITWMENIKGEAGWKMCFIEDPLFNSDSLKAVYQQLEPTVEHRYSVPLLVDKKNKLLLSTSSAEIVRYVAKGFDDAFSVAYDLIPNKLIKDIDEMNQWLHDKINRAVYLVGFATQQSDYEYKLNELFKALDELEERLKKQLFLFSDQLTESDLYLLATLERFDNIYFCLFKCSLKRIADYPALFRYHNQLRGMESLASTFQPELTKEHYFMSTMHVLGEARELNPSKIIPIDYYP